MSCIYFQKKFGLRGDVYSGVESTLNFFVGVTKNNSKKTYTVEDLNLCGTEQPFMKTLLLYPWFVTSPD